MRELFILIAHLLVTLANLAPGAVLARWRQNHWRPKPAAHHEARAASCAESDLMGSAGAGSLCTFGVTKRLSKMAVILKPSTLLCFHYALVKRKYRLLYSPTKRRRPGPKGPSKELIGVVIEMKRRNPRFGCRKIAEQISRAFAVEINKDVVRRILIQHYRPVPGGDGPSWFTVIAAR